jgi:hypothetical protein
MHKMILMKTLKSIKVISNVVNDKKNFQGWKRKLISGEKKNLFCVEQFFLLENLVFRFWNPIN